MAMHPIAMTPFWNRREYGISTGRADEMQKCAYEGVVLAADGLGGAAVAHDVGAADADGDAGVADLGIDLVEELLHILGLGLQ